MPTRRTGRGGVEVRVFGGGLGDHRQGARQGGEGNEPAVEESSVEIEEVVRLDHGALPLANRRMEDEEPGTTDVLPRSRRRRSLSQRTWTVLMACIAVLVSVIVVFAAGTLKKDPPGPESYFEKMQVVDDPEDGIDVVNNADELLENAMELFSDYSAARTVDEVIPTIRNGESLRSKLTKRWKPVGEAMDVNGLVKKLGEKIVVLLQGKQSSGELFEYLLVLGDDGFEVDWEASTGMGDMDFDRLKDLEIGESVRMRLLLKAATFHPLDFPDEEFRCYNMRHFKGSGSVFGYARIGSKPAQVLADALNEGSILLEEVSDFAAIVRLKNEGRGELGQFTITGIIEEGWVEP